MRKNLWLLILSSLPTILLFAKGTVYIQNNTPVNFKLEVNQFGTSLSQGDYWNTIGNDELFSGQKLRGVLWYNRNSGIKNGMEYRFDTHIKTSDGRILITLEQKLVGTWRFSNYWMSIRNDNMETEWIDTYDIQTKSFYFDNEEYIIEYCGDYNPATTSDDVLYVIHKVNPYNIIDTSNSNKELNILAYNIFAIITQSTSDIMNRINALPELLQNIPADEPVIIAGDLNVDKAHYPEEYSSMLTILNATEPQATQNSLDLSADISRNNLAGDNEYLDYVLYANDHLKPINSLNAILLFKSLDHNLWKSWELSDHFPCYGYFKFE